jgi:uncharacterized protein (DUF1499 family)
MKITLLVLLVVALALLAYVRLAPSDRQVWHKDPLSAKLPNKPNAFLFVPGNAKFPTPLFETDATSLAAAFDRFALSQPRVSQLANSEAGLLVTYEVRSRLMGYPDYLSIRFINLDSGGATLAVFSRARFGYSDTGVNRKRILGWLKNFTP